jgi:hypothetical protein
MQDDHAPAGRLCLKAPRRASPGRPAHVPAPPESKAARRHRLELVRAELARARAKDPEVTRGAATPKAAGGARRPKRGGT